MWPVPCRLACAPCSCGGVRATTHSPPTSRASRPCRLSTRCASCLLSSDAMVQLRDLTTLDEFRAVERLESEIWGDVDLVPVPILAVTARRGAVLVGAHDGDRLVGFVYSFPVLKPGEARPSHWSHMLAVHHEYRRSG